MNRAIGMVFKKQMIQPIVKMNAIFTF